MLRTLCLFLVLSATSTRAAEPLVSKAADAEPITLGRILALDGKGGLRVTEKRSRPINDNSKCHDVVCAAIVIPFILAEMAMAKEVADVTVSRADGQVYSGRFLVDGGKLVYLMAKGKDGWKSLQRLSLPKLGRDAIVVVRKAKDPRGPWEDVPLQSELDLVSEYETAAKDRSGANLAELVAEAAMLLRKDAEPLVLRTVDPKQPDETRAALMTALYKNGSTELAPKAAEVIAKSPSPSASLAALQCTHFVPATLRPALLAGLTSTACTGDAPADAIEPIRAALKDPATATATRAAIDQCAVSPRSTWLRACLQLPATREAYADALTSSGPWADRIRSCLDPDLPVHRPGLIEALRSQPQLRRWPEAFASSKLPLTSAELDALAESYVRDLGLGRYAVRAFALVSFSKSAPDQRAAAIARIQAALDKLPPPSAPRPSGGLGAITEHVRGMLNVEDDQRPSMHVALAVLGQRDHGAAAARGVAEHSNTGKTPTTVVNQSDLVTFGLTLIGCSQAQIDGAASKARAQSAEVTGDPCAAK